MRYQIGKNERKNITSNYWFVDKCIDDGNHEIHFSRFPLLSLPVFVILFYRKSVLQKYLFGKRVPFGAF